MDERGSVRIGDVERQAAVDALTVHREAGRLDSTEYEERQVAAVGAHTWAEIAPLFRDLPAPRPVGMPSGIPTEGDAAGEAAPVVMAGLPREPSRGVLGGFVPPRYRDTVMALTPLLAVVLFFVTGSWLWFLAIPAMGILLYGPEGKSKRKAGH